MFMQEKVKLECPMYANKFERCIFLEWDVVIKKLNYVKLVYMQYNIEDSQALFWCSVLIILEMARRGTLLLCSAGQQACLCS